MTTSDIGGRFARAVAAKDTEALSAVLAPQVDFKGLTPKRFWEASSSDEVADVFFGSWFEDHDHIDELLDVTVGDPVEDVRRIGYRLKVTTPDGPHVVEQQAYYWADDTKIHYLRVICSGMRPLTG